MRGEVIIVRDGLNGAAPWLNQVLREAGLTVHILSEGELSSRRPADAVLLGFAQRDPMETCWRLRRQGHRAVVAISTAASSSECIRILNGGADYYLDAWLPKAELVARVGVVLRYSRWLDEQAAHFPAVQGAAS